MAVTDGLVRAGPGRATSVSGPDRAALERVVRQKRALIFGLSAGAFSFFLVLPVLSFFTTALDGRAYGSVTWAYVFMFAQFAMGLVCIHVFLVRAAALDAAARAAGSAHAAASTPVSS